MREFLQNYWYVAATFSALYTFGSVWWTASAERRLRKLAQEARVSDLALEYVERDLAEVQRYLEGCPTIKTPVSKVYTIQ